MRLIRIYNSTDAAPAMRRPATHTTQRTITMNPGFAALLTGLGLVLIALPWVFGVQRSTSAS